MARLDYWTPTRGWWTGHSDLPPTKASLEEYVAGLNAVGNYRVRVLDGDALIGDACAVCQEPHDGLDGACLI